MPVAGATFLVTGGSSGLGAACVSRLKAVGANVIVADIHVPPGDPQKDASGILQCRVDVTNPEDVTVALEAALQHFGALNGVVNCAGILGAARVLGRDGPHDLDLFRRVIE